MRDCQFVDLNAIMEEGRQVTVLWQEDESLAFVANGRAYRSEFHVNPSAETMLQLRGEMRLHYLTPEGEEKVRVLKEGEYMYCPPGLPHSPRFRRGPLRSSPSAGASRASATASSGSASAAGPRSTKPCSRSATTPRTRSAWRTVSTNGCASTAPVRPAGT